jgi:lipopolysaccharide/colanic/teichoic acid biosynthesis glycosyltransferase
MKRLLDLLFSAIGLLLLSPLFIVVAAFILLDSRGGAFYLQERTGQGGLPFRLIKFRTMTRGAEKARAITVGRRDKRITRTGYYLRKFKIDELPQLINVLTGEMSLVGPRPELRTFTDHYTEAQRKVLSVRPGITDPASIRFRNENEMLEGRPDPIAYYEEVILPEKLSLNLKYIESRSLFGDVKIILATLVSIFRH